MLSVIRRAVAAGVDWIQLREKDLPTRELLHLAREAVTATGSARQPVAAASGAWNLKTRILINDRLDVALAAGAAGVHLGEESIPVAAVTRWRKAGHAPPGFSVGASCHSLAAAQAAERDAADYVFFGPVFATPSKQAFGPAQGTARLTQVCRGVRIPVLAIGGITVENAGECLAAGAAGIAAIRLFQDSADLAAVVARLRSLP